MKTYQELREMSIFDSVEYIHNLSQEDRDVIMEQSNEYRAQNTPPIDLVRKINRLETRLLEEAIFHDEYREFSMDLIKKHYTQEEQLELLSGCLEAYIRVKNKIGGENETRSHFQQYIIWSSNL